MTKERAGSIIFLAVGIYGIVLSLCLPFGSLSEPGAAAFPLIVSILLFLSGLFVFFSGKENVETNWRKIVEEQRTPFRIVILTAAFIAALNLLGYLMTSTLYIFALLSWVSRYKIWIAAASAIAIGIVSWYVFGILFETPLPQGFLTF
jgi:putative tricarboxylic transport membrane protein